MARGWQFTLGLILGFGLVFAVLWMLHDCDEWEMGEL